MIKLHRIILLWPPIDYVVKKSKTMVIPGFKGMPVYDVVVFFFRQINKVGLNERASAITFNLIMALPAAMLFLFSLIPYFPTSFKVEAQILKLFKDITPNSQTYAFIKNLINDLLVKHVGVFSFGFLLLIFYASNAMMGIIRTFDRSIQEHKGFFMHRRWRAIRLTAILIVLIIASSLILIGQEQLASLVRSLFQLKRKTTLPYWNGVRWSIIIGLLFTGISLIYTYAPSVKKKWSFVSAGSLLATTLTLLTTLIFSYWVDMFASSSYNKVYGSIGTVLIIMLLMYINSLILLIGFELNVSLTYLTKQKNQSVKNQSSAHQFASKVS